MSIKALGPVLTCPQCSVPLRDTSLTAKTCAVCGASLEDSDGAVAVNALVNVVVALPVAVQRIKFKTVVKKPDTSGDW